MFCDEDLLPESVRAVCNLPHGPYCIRQRQARRALHIASRLLSRTSAVTQQSPHHRPKRVVMIGVGEVYRPRPYQYTFELVSVHGANHTLMLDLSGGRELLPPVEATS